MTPHSQFTVAEQNELQFILSDEFQRRFKKFVVPNVSGCWEWTGAKDRHGYGNVRTVRPYQRRTHRVALMIKMRRMFSREQFACHTCDNRACVNPDHLWLGDNNSNMADMVRKGRSNPRPREKLPATKVSNEQVEEMRRQRADGERVIDIARQYGLTPNHAGWLINHYRPALSMNEGCVRNAY